MLRSLALALVAVLPLHCSYGFLDPAYWPAYGQPPEKDVEDARWLIARYLDRTLM